MLSGPPSTIQIEELPRGVRYVLPKREPGVLRVLGIPFVVVGGGFIFVPMLMLLISLFAAATAFGAKEGTALLFLLGIMLFLVPFVLIGVALFGFGMHIIAGNSELELRDERITMRDGWWRLKWRRRCNVTDVRRVILALPSSTMIKRRYWRDPATASLHQVDQDKVQSQAVDSLKNTPFGFLSDDLGRALQTGMLRIAHVGGEPMQCLSGYPPDLLRPIGQEIARRCEVPFEDAVSANGERQTEPQVQTVPAETESNAHAVRLADPTPELSAPLEQIDGVDTSPVASGAANFRDRRLVDSGRHAYSIAPTGTTRGLHAMVAGMGAFPLLATLLSRGVPDWGNWNAWGFMLIGVPFLLIGLALLTRRSVRFDQGGGVMTYGWLWPLHERELSDVRALQIIPAKYVRSRSSVGSSRSSSYQPFELNLVFHDGSRFNLLSNTDLKYIRESGQQLASFLNAPLLDQS